MRIGTGVRGAVYVGLFPDHADRVQLNSVDPPGGVRDGIENKGLAVDQAVPWFARWAAAESAGGGAVRTACGAGVPGQFREQSKCGALR